MSFTFASLEIDVVNTCDSWGVLVSWISSDAHIIAIFIFVVTLHVESISINEGFKMVFNFEVMWSKRAFLNGELVFG